MSHQPDNIAAGTQVVSLVEVRGTNSALVHPRGAVDVVTRTPAVAGEKFLVRFPDGFEFSLPREQLEVLKHFKARLGAARTHSLAPIGGEGQGEGVSAVNPGFDLDSGIICRCVVGSRAYRLDYDDSDTDRRGARSPCSRRSRPPTCKVAVRKHLFGAPEQFEDNATQSCYWELQKFLTMALKANPNILGCLYSPLVEKVTPLGEELVALRQGLLSQMIVQTFNGYAMSQFKKIERDLRNHGDRIARSARRDENGKNTPRGPGGQRRWKPAMHLLRLVPVRKDLTGAATLREGRVPVRVEAHRDRLLAVKRGELPWADCPSPIGWERVPKAGEGSGLGARNSTATSSALWPKPNCPNAPTTRRPIASSSKQGEFGHPGGRPHLPNCTSSKHSLTKCVLLIASRPYEFSGSHP